VRRRRGAIEDRDGVDVIQREDALPVAGIGRIFSFMPVVTILRSVGAVGAVVGEVFREGIGQAHLARAVEPLLHGHLQRMVVGVECSFERVNGTPTVERHSPR
jgi:hypothetical protein